MGLPQELLKAIVEVTDDTPTFKSCALIGTKLREQSQRILFSSLKLAGEYHPARCAFLDGSPNIASYVTELTLYIPDEEDIAHPTFSTTDIRSILVRLLNSRRGVLGGMDGIRSPWSRWPALPFYLSSAHLEFISRQHWSLREVILTNIRALPPDVLLSLVGAAPSLDFTRVDLVQDMLEPGRSWRETRPSPFEPRAGVPRHMSLPCMSPACVANERLDPPGDR